MKNKIPCSHLKFKRHFGAKRRLHFEGQIIRARYQFQSRWQTVYWPFRPLNRLYPYISVGAPTSSSTTLCSTFLWRPISCTLLFYPVHAYTFLLTCKSATFQGYKLPLVRSVAVWEPSGIISTQGEPMRNKLRSSVSLLFRTWSEVPSSVLLKYKSFKLGSG
jgi:hypothetical protein